MRKAILLYNPASGQRLHRREEQVESVAAILRAAGVEAAAEPTWDAGTAGQQAAEAIAAGCDTVIACGGDGTVQDVLQGMVGTTAHLGVIPLGTGNVLAHDIGIPRKDPAAAARVLLQATPTEVALGRLDFPRKATKTRTRYFIAITGIGAEAQLFYSLSDGYKQRTGMVAYYTESFRQWLSYHFPLFEVEFRDLHTGQMRNETVSQVLAVRIGFFGGVLRNLAPGAALAHRDFRLVLFKTRSKLTYLRFITATLLGFSRNISGIELTNATELRCQALDGSDGARIYVEADGELLGSLPVSVSLVPDALHLLLPNKPPVLR